MNSGKKNMIEFIEIQDIKPEALSKFVKKYIVSEENIILQGTSHLEIEKTKGDFMLPRGFLNLSYIEWCNLKRPFSFWADPKKGI
jgi:hypothetical protein